MWTRPTALYPGSMRNLYCIWLMLRCCVVDRYLGRTCCCAFVYDVLMYYDQNVMCYRRYTRFIRLGWFRVLEDICYYALNYARSSRGVVVHVRGRYVYEMYMYAGPCSPHLLGKSTLFGRRGPRKGDLTSAPLTHPHSSATSSERGESRPPSDRNAAERRVDRVRAHPPGPPSYGNVLPAQGSALRAPRPAWTVHTPPLLYTATRPRAMPLALRLSPALAAPRLRTRFVPRHSLFRYRMASTSAVRAGACGCLRVHG